MSRPATRGKNKRPKDKVDVTSEILRKIHATGEVSSNDVNQLYMIGKPVCQGCRVNTKDNPNCFCGLVPPPNGSRKTGLWQKMSEIVDALGLDPCKDLRESANYPAGLTNLGATCYANSILQCLYMNTSFRESLFSVEPEVLKQQPVLDQLARLFAQLHASKMAFIDSAPFIKTLELDNGVQQDSHEFLTLLLSLLERCLSHSKIAKARTVVQDLFRGRVSHVTTCSKCGKDSEASSKMEDFYELELNVKGLKSLDESLNDYLSAENLDGENQYFCDSCETRVDATRSIKLRTLPNVLNFQLKRYVFLPKTTTKKKITSAFCFPGQLDMRQRLSEPSELNWVYDLSAVLLHKGSAVNSGHYVAHIKDGKTGQWWEFDDEQVSNLGQHPFGEGSSKVSAKGVQGEPVTDLTGEGKRNGLANGNHRDHIQPWSSLSGSGCSGETFSSTDAYLLMYNLRCSRKDTEKPPNPAAGNIKPEGHSDTSHDDFSLPFQMLDEIKNMNASYLEACEEYKSKKNKEVSCITERREEVRSILSEAPVQSPNETFYWISTEWLRQWADNITLPVIDNRSIQCSHGKVPVSKVNSMKRLSAGAWTRLYSKCNGGPTLSKDDHCITCLIDGAQSVVCADSYRDRRNLMKELANQVLTGNCDDGSYYVSKTWLQQWVRRKNIDSPSEADAGPASALMCPHGQLMPDRAPGAKRLLVPENLWLFFYQDATAVKPDDPMSTAVFPSDSEQCTKCSNELSEVACLESSLREEKLRHRQNHEKLATGKSIPLSLNTKYNLVPSSWLAKWRSYVNASGKNISSAEEPENLDHVIDLLRCEKHMRLLERPPELISRRGVLFQKSSQTDGLTIIAEHDWNKFCEEWGCDKLKGISVTIESNNVTENSVDGFCKMEIDVENPSSLEEPNDEIQTVQPIIRNCPEVCEDCVGERETCELMEKLNYCNEDISVSLIRGKEPPRSILQTAETSTDPDRRASKRSRKSNSGNSVNLKVSGTTTIYQLKMMIWESLGVVKENQILHKGSKVLDKEAATLADMNIFPGDKLWVQDSEIYEHRDIADELADNKMGTDHSEEGFRGTLLMADISSHVI